MVATKIIIDTDPGIDDAVAIALGCGADEVDLVGVTVIFGNSDDMTVMSTNAQRLLALCGKNDVPMRVGADRPLQGQCDSSSGRLVHGEDGAGGKSDELPALPQGWKPHPQHAADFIIEQCKNAPGEIVLVTIGPLTNVALALQKCPELVNLTKRVVVMGGAVEGPLGNKRPVAEANIYCDPEAAQIVFRGGFPDLVMVGLDVTHKTDFSPALREWLVTSGAINGRGVGTFLVNASKHYAELYKSRGCPIVPMHDASAVMCAFKPEYFKGEKLSVDVECSGEFTRGMTVVDRKGQFKTPKNVTVMFQVTMAPYYNTFKAAIAKTDGTTVAAVDAALVASAAATAGDRGGSGAGAAADTRMELPMSNGPRIGVACHIIAFDHPNCILIGQRKAAHGEGKYACPGGHLEPGEEWWQCAARETMEETGIEVAKPQIEMFAVTNDIMRSDNRHYVTIHMRLTVPAGVTPRNCEPHKCNGWEWRQWDDIAHWAKRDEGGPLFQSMLSLVADGQSPL